MPNASDFPQYTKLSYQRDGAARASFVADIEEMLAAGKRKLSQFSEEAKATLDSALSVKRNDAGSLDLGVPQLREAAAAQQARAMAAREVAEALAITAREEGKYTQEVRQSIAAAKALAREEEVAAQAALARANAAEQVQERLNRQASATEMVMSATKRGTEANHMMVNSVRSQRVAFVQAGQQMQDMAIQFQMGTKASTIMAQQLPQLGFAFSGLEGNANRTLDKLGRFGTFIAGPWGAALTIGLVALGPLIDKIFESGEEAGKAKDKTYDFAKSLDVLALSAKDTASAMDQLASATANAIKVQGDFLVNQAANADQAVSAIESRIASAQAELAKINRDNERYGIFGTSYGETAILNSGRKSELEGQIANDTAALRSARLAQQNAAIALSQRRVTDALDESSAAATQYNTAVGKLNEQFKRSKDDPIGASMDGTFISQQQYEKEFARLTKIKKAADEAQKSVRGSGSGLYGREIGMAEARSIAASAGFQVNSGTRPTWIRDEKPGGPSSQERLYNKWIAQGRPKDNPTAAPGTSAHESSNALDIQFGKGITAASIKKAYADEGVRLTKILKERGHFHIEWSTKGADKVEREAEQLAAFGKEAAERVMRINEAFDEQPRLIDRANQATRELDSTIEELRAKKPVDWEKSIADAEAAKDTIQEALVRPYQEITRESERRIEIEALLASGREDEAEALRIIWQYEERNADLREDQKAAILDQVKYERQITEELRARQDIIGAYLDASRSVKQELVSIFSGSGSIGNLQNTFKQLNAQVMVEKIFGPMFRDLDKWVKEQSGVTSSVDFFADETKRAGTEAGNLANALGSASKAIMGGKAGGSVVAPIVGGAANDNSLAGILQRISDQSTGDIIVMADKTNKEIKNLASNLSPDVFARQIGEQMARALGDTLPGIFGGKAAQGILGGAMYGNMVGGAPGAVLGALGGIPGLPSGLGNIFSMGLQGLSGASMITDIAASFGIKVPTEAKYGLLTGLFKAIFGGAKYGNASFQNGVMSVNGNNSDLKTGAQSSGDSLLSTLNQIADGLDATLGAFSVSLGQTDGKWRISTTGRTGELKSKYSDVQVFGTGDAAYQQALEAAIRDAISDGAIQGISQAAQNILKAGGDLQKAIEKAALVQSIPRQLKQLTDPVGYAVDELNREFTKVVDALKLGSASAAEYADAEKLYNLKRAEAIKQASEQVMGSLKSLYDDLTVGNDAFSLRDRLTGAYSKFDPLKDRVAAGDSTAYADFADAARVVMDLERQLNGSQGGYFSFVDSLKELTKSEMDRQQAMIDAASSSANPFSSTAIAANDNQGVIDALGQTNNLLSAILQNQILGLQTGTGGGYSFDLSGYSVGNYY